MVAKLEMKLQCEEPLAGQMASLFHGALMECLPTGYAGYLHDSGQHPYTQHLERREQDWYWIVTALNREMAQTMLQDVLFRLERVELKKKEMSVAIVQKEYAEVDIERAWDRLYESEPEKRICVRFLTPTAFKQQGSYTFYPDIRCVYQSLMNKYDASFGNTGVLDEEVLKELYEKTKIIRYNLRSVSFHLEGVRIPAFLGNVTFALNGNRTLSNFAKLLFWFGEYSGVGIKTSLGMGAVRIVGGSEKREVYLD